MSTTITSDRNETTPAAGSTARALLPLAVDVAVPLAVYLAARNVLGLSLIVSLVAASVVPVVRTVAGYAATGRINALAATMLVVNLAGIGSSLITGNLRIDAAKSGVVSAVVALALLVSALRDRPVLSPALAAFVTRGDTARTTAWQFLHETSNRFRSLERRFTLVYGLALLAECAARVVVSFTAPVDMLGWLPTALLLAGLGVAVVVGGGVAADPITTLVDDEVAARDRAVSLRSA